MKKLMQCLAAVFKKGHFQIQCYSSHIYWIGEGEECIVTSVVFIIFFSITHHYSQMHPFFQAELMAFNYHESEFADICIFFTLQTPRRLMVNATLSAQELHSGRKFPISLLHIRRRTSACSRYERERDLGFRINGGQRKVTALLTFAPINHPSSFTAAFRKVPCG